jgi:hypothetical protein
VTRFPRLLRLIHRFPGKKYPMRESLPRAALGLAEACIGSQRREARPGTEAPSKEHQPRKAFGQFVYTDFLLDRAGAERTNGILFVIVAPVAAGALIPELFLIVFFQRGRPSRRNHFAICSLPYPCGGSTEHLSIFCIEVKPSGLETSRRCR